VHASELDGVNVNEIDISIDPAFIFGKVLRMMMIKMIFGFGFFIMFFIMNPIVSGVWTRKG